MLSWAASEGGRSVGFVGFEALMKPLNVWPMLILLIAVIFIVIWLRPHS